MMKNHGSIKEEEKVENDEKIIPFHNSEKLTNYKLNINVQSEINNENSLILISNLSNKSMTNKANIKNKDLNKESKNIDSYNVLNQKTIDNNNVFNKIEITNKLNKTENKNNKNINPNNNLKPITLNKEELYNAFILFQQLMSKYDNDIENNVEYIKNRLFEFISMKKNNYFTETIECNDNYNDNENFLDIQNYMQIYCKTDKDLNLNNINFRNNQIDMIKNYSFSYNMNDKKKIFNNYFNTFLNDAKETIKSNSQLFNEYLLIDKKFKDKTLSEDSFHHNYSFDRKNKEKTELSFHSINKEKDNEKDNYLIIENNEMVNSYNYNSYEKEIKHKSPFDNKDFYIYRNNFKKYSTEEDLLINPLEQNNKIIKLSECNDTQNEENDLYHNKNNSFKEKIIISPSKQITNKFEKINNENKKSNLEIQQSLSGLQEIKVNKKKTLNSKEQLINDKIKELNEEIKKFKEETNKVTLIKEEYEKLQDKLLKDIKEFNIKKQMNQKNCRNSSQSEVKLIMSITQHNQSLIISNNKKKETIQLLRQRIYELENIIKTRNNYELTNKKIIFKKINNTDKNCFPTEQSNIFTKKRNILKKKNNDSYILKKARINLKKKLESHSSEKIKKNKNINYNNEIINQTMNNNNLSKMYFDSKHLVKINYNKKLMNASYNHHNIKNSILNSKISYNNLNNNNNYFKKIVNSNRNLKKKNNMNNNINIPSINIRNNSINSGLNNTNKQKNDNDVIHTNLYIYEKLINKEREKDKNYKKINININSERDLGHRKIIKELKTETLEKNKAEKDKKFSVNLHLFENKSNAKKYQKSHGKNLLISRFDLKTDINKNKSNLNVLSTSKIKSKNHSINKKIKTSAHPIIRNTTNAKIKKSRDELKNIMKEINNSVDNKDMNKDIIINTNNDNTDLEDENENDNDTDNKYDFVIPKIYRNKNMEIINKMESDGKKINIYADNRKEIIFKSGVKKEIYQDGYQLVYFPNGDMKQKFVGEDEKFIYYYSETNTVQTTFKNGLNIFKFSNGQIEKHYSDGSKYIIYTNGIKRKISRNGKEEVIIPEEQRQGDNINKNNEAELNKEGQNNTNNGNEKMEENLISKRSNFHEENNLLKSFLDLENL